MVDHPVDDAVLIPDMNAHTTLQAYLDCPDHRRDILDALLDHTVGLRVACRRMFEHGVVRPPALKLLALARHHRGPEVLKVDQSLSNCPFIARTLAQHFVGSFRSRPLVLGHKPSWGSFRQLLISNAHCRIASPLMQVGRCQMGIVSRSSCRTNWARCL